MRKTAYFFGLLAAVVFLFGGCASSTPDFPQVDTVFVQHIYPAGDGADFLRAVDLNAPVKLEELEIPAGGGSVTAALITDRDSWNLYSFAPACVEKDGQYFAYAQGYDIAAVCELAAGAAQASEPAEGFPLLLVRDDNEGNVHRTEETLLLCLGEIIGRARPGAEEPEYNRMSILITLAEHKERFHFFQNGFLVQTEETQSRFYEYGAAEDFSRLCKSVERTDAGDP